MRFADDLAKSPQLCEGQVRSQRSRPDRVEQRQPLTEFGEGRRTSRAVYPRGNRQDELKELQDRLEVFGRLLGRFAQVRLKAQAAPGTSQLYRLERSAR